jgi:transposase-like protein
MLADLLSKSYAADFDESWENKRTATPVRGVRRPPPRNRLFTQRNNNETRGIRLERLYGTVWNWVHRLADSVPDPPSAQPTRVAVDETAVRLNSDLYWLYPAIDIESKLLLGVDLCDSRGTDPVTEFLHQLTEKHALSTAEFLVDGYSYLTGLARLDLSDHLDYVDRNLMMKWLHTLEVSVDRFHHPRVESQAAVEEWLVLFAYYYNVQKPHQALDDRPPAELAN